MAIVYLASFVALWAAVVLVRKSEEKQNLFVWIPLGAMAVLGFQALLAGIVNKIGIGVTLVPAALGNLAAAGGCFYLIARKGRQAFAKIKVLDVISFAVILGMIAVYSFSKYGRNLDIIDFISVDATAHTRWAIEVALEHKLSINLYFTSLNTGLMMQAYQGLTGCGRFDLYHVFIWCEIFYTTLAATLFWGLIRQRCGEGRWQRFVPLLLTPFYWAGYPVYATLFGFSYLGMAVCLMLVMVTLLEMYVHKRISMTPFIIGMNLMLYGIFVCYTLFVPVAFFGVFATVGWQMKKTTEPKLISLENFLTMLKIFLIPTILGLIYSFANVGALGEGGGILNEGGCYNDCYSNFILLIPFMILGVYFLIHRKEGGYFLPMAAVHIAFQLIMFIGLLTRHVSVYYYTKLNSVLWMVSWVLIAEAILGMMVKCKWAVFFPFFFYGVAFTGKYLDTWISRANPLARRVETWNFCDIIMLNNTYFNFRSVLNPETMELYRYADEHYGPGEIASVHFELENGWFKTLTGQENIYTYVDREDLLGAFEKYNIDYILCGTSSGTYQGISDYIDAQETIIENEAGKIVKVTMKTSDFLKSDLARENQKKDETEEADEGASEAGDSEAGGSETPENESTAGAEQ